METAVIVAILALIGQIILALFQLRNTKSQAKKIDTETSSILIDKALNISKQENDILRQLNQTLREELNCCKLEIAEKIKEIKGLEEQLELCQDTTNLLEKELDKKEK